MSLTTEERKLIADSGDTEPLAFVSGLALMAVIQKEGVRDDPELRRMQVERAIDYAEFIVVGLLRRYPGV